MSDELEISPREARGSGEGKESENVQKLENATLEPRAYVEQSGDYKQSEEIQNDFAT